MCGYKFNTDFDQSQTDVGSVFNCSNDKPADMSTLNLVIKDQIKQCSEPIRCL